MSQWLINTKPTFAVAFAPDGNQGEVTGPVNVTATRGNGTTLAGPATATLVGSGSTAYYTWTPTSVITQVDELTFAWEDDATGQTITTLESIVGNLLFTETQARTFGAKDNGTAPLASATEYTDATIRTARDRISDELEEWTGRSWVSRYCRAEFAGDGTRDLFLQDGMPRLSDGQWLQRRARTMDVASILSVTIGGTAVATSNFAVGPNGMVRRTNGSFTSATTTNPFNVVVEWEYGLAFPMEGVDRVALAILVDRLVPSAYPERALSWDSEFGTVRMVTEGGPMGNRTRIPFVNQWLDEHDYRAKV